MCLGIPGEILDIREQHGLRFAKVRFGGITRDVCLECQPDAGVGDYVLVHVGFAIARIDRDEAAHGPGCPVCVTPLEMIDRAHTLARRPEIIFASFGDMLRVPGSRGDLLRLRSQGADVRVVYSPLDAVALARQHVARGGLLRHRLRDDGAGQRDGDPAGAPGKARQLLDALVARAGAAGDRVDPAGAGQPRAGLPRPRPRLRHHGRARVRGARRALSRAHRRHRPAVGAEGDELPAVMGLVRIIAAHDHGLAGRVEPMRDVVEAEDARALGDPERAVAEGDAVRILEPARQRHHARRVRAAGVGDERVDVARLPGCSMLDLRPLVHRQRRACGKRVAAVARRRGGTSNEPRGRMRVADVMSWQPVVVDATDTVQEAAHRMRAHVVGALPVLDDGELVGIVTDRDLAMRVIAAGRRPSETRVDQVMTPRPLYCTAGEELETAVGRMLARRVRRIVVTDGDGAVVGLLSLDDLAADGRTHALALAVLRASAPHQDELDGDAAYVP